MKEFIVARRADKRLLTILISYSILYVLSTGILLIYIIMTKQLDEELHFFAMLVLLLLNTYSLLQVATSTYTCITVPRIMAKISDGVLYLHPPGKKFIPIDTLQIIEISHKKREANQTIWWILSGLLYVLLHNANAYTYITLLFKLEDGSCFKFRYMQNAEQVCFYFREWWKENKLYTTGSANETVSKISQ